MLMAMMMMIEGNDDANGYDWTPKIISSEDVAWTNSRPVSH